MSVHNESMDLHKQTDRTDEVPSLEYRAVSHDSFSMFLAAVGGAILGVLLTLLILAIINGGTLSFAQSANVAALEQTVSRVDENLGTLSANFDVVTTEMAQIRSSLANAESSLRSAVSSQGEQVASVSGQMEQVNEALVTLEQTRQRFDVFVAALSTALAEANIEPPATSTP
jgi:hypothetical protein